MAERPGHPGAALSLAAGAGRCLCATGWFGAAREAGPQLRRNSISLAHAAGRQGDTQPRLRWPLPSARKCGASYGPSRDEVPSPTHLDFPSGGEARVRGEVPRQHRALCAQGVCAAAQVCAVRFPGSLGLGAFRRNVPGLWSYLRTPCGEHPPGGRCCPHRGSPSYRGPAATKQVTTPHSHQVSTRAGDCSGKPTDGELRGVILLRLRRGFGPHWPTLAPRRHPGRRTAPPRGHSSCVSLRGPSPSCPSAFPPSFLCALLAFPPPAPLAGTPLPGGSRPLAGGSHPQAGR